MGELARPLLGFDRVHAAAAHEDALRRMLIVQEHLDRRLAVRVDRVADRSEQTFQTGLQH